MDQPIIRKLLAIQESQDQIARFFSVFQDIGTEDLTKKSAVADELLSLFHPQFKLVVDDGVEVSEATDRESMHNIAGFLSESPADVLVGAPMLHSYADNAGEVEIMMKGVCNFVINTVGKYAGQLVVTRNEYTLKGKVESLKFCYLKISVMSEHIFRQSQ